MSSKNNTKLNPKKYWTGKQYQTIIMLVNELMKLASWETEKYSMDWQLVNHICKLNDITAHGQYYFEDDEIWDYYNICLNKDHK